MDNSDRKQYTDQYAELFPNTGCQEKGQVYKSPPIGQY